MRLRLFDRHLGRTAGHHLAEAELSVEHCQTWRRENGERLGVRHKLFVAHPLDVRSDANHAVRIMADQVGIDESPRDRRGLGRIATGALHDCGHQLDELCRRKDFHGRL